MKTKKVESPREAALKRRRNVIVVAALILLFIILLVIEVTTQDISASSPVGNYVIFYSFYNIIFMLLLILVYLIVRNIVKLYFERERLEPGAKFRTKLIVSFFLLTSIPSVVLFFYARFLISQTMEYWFSVPIEQSLQGAIRVSEQYYDDIKGRAENFSSIIGKSILRRNLLAEKNKKYLRNYIKSKVNEYDMDVIYVYNSSGKKVMEAYSKDVDEDRVIKPDDDLIKKILSKEKLSTVIPADEGELIYGLVSLENRRKKKIGVVAVGYYLPRSLTEDIKSAAMAFEDYRQKEILKKPIANTYVGMFAIVTILVIFAAMWFGLQLAKEITIPIKQLAEGTREVSNGNLDFHIDIKVSDKSEDEIGILVDSFNKMTNDIKMKELALQEKNLSLQKTNRELDRRRSYIETVLENIGTGVISLDIWGRITTINSAAEEMLHIKASDFTGKLFKDAFSTSKLDPLKKLFLELEESGNRSIEDEVNLNIKGEVFTFMINVSKLFDSENNEIGVVMVLENMTELIRAQRVAAWREVARRIAHEIKNPLTPIKLSAQRLKKKYFQEGNGDKEVFVSCVDTIIQEVDDLKKMVNEFSNFARMPSFNPVDVNIKELAEETISLYKTSMKNVKININNGKDIPLLKLDPEQIKRVFINLIDNAIESMDGNGEINISFEYMADLQTVKIEVSDNGRGIPPNVKEKLFLPYFSTKKSGTGLGLAIVNSIISEHRGYIRVKDNIPRGTTFVIELPVRGV
ncbi:MAG: PAS domain-containing protein [Candidatus Schekmanbacteria bacterium]|nr:MAG: PAS domain-containing protein [Candidatus Schekmanbacteria bacterium]